MSWAVSIFLRLLDPPLHLLLHSSSSSRGIRSGRRDEPIFPSSSYLDLSNAPSFPLHLHNQLHLSTTSSHPHLSMRAPSRPPSFLSMPSSHLHSSTLALFFVLALSPTPALPPGIAGPGLSPRSMGVSPHPPSDPPASSMRSPSPPPFPPQHLQPFLVP